MVTWTGRSFTMTQDKGAKCKNTSADLAGMPSQVKNVTVCLPNQVEGDEDTFLCRLAKS